MCCDVIHRGDGFFGSRASSVYFAYCEVAVNDVACGFLDHSLSGPL